VKKCRLACPFKRSLTEVKGVIIYMKALGGLWVKITRGLCGFLNWIKESCKGICGVLRKNYFSVCLILLITITFILFSTRKDFKHSREKFLLMEDNIRIQYVLKDYERRLVEQDEVIKFQGDVMGNWRKSLESQETALIRSRDIINSYKATIDALVGYLKKLGEWPPKIDPPGPVDPSKWNKVNQGDSAQ
jgi:hypothetical protein